MNQIDELKSVERIIHKYNLPMSPIQEYAISEKCEALTGCSEFHDSMTEHDVIGRVREQIQSIMKGYHLSLFAYTFGGLWPKNLEILLTIT